jgi:3-hydroxybutyryl-CoA dehydrogenase
VGSKMQITKDLKIGIIGIGKVGMSILQAFAQSGFNVLGVDVNKEMIENNFEKVKDNLNKLVKKGKFSTEEKENILKRMEFSTDMQSLKDRNIVIEAVFENMEVKKDIFKKLDEIVKSKEALLLTNTSSLSVSEIASVTTRPEKVAGMHFFNPVPVMKLVEIVKGVLSSDDTIEKIKELAKLMGKVPIVSKDSPGFIVNRMLNALTVEAAKIVEEGVGSIEDVDIGAKLGLGHPMGPFELFDYLDAIHLVVEVTEYMAEELGERFKMPVWVKNLVKAGLTGKSKGRGFYKYK